MSWSPSPHRPILSLAVDALNDLDGADAVTGLWTGTSILSLPRFSPSSFLFYISTLLPNFPTNLVFTKCKGSLQDGPRLEYISWRLWYRQLEAHRTNKPLPIPPHSPHLIPVSCPLTPVSELGIEHPGKLSHSHPPSLSLFLTWHTCFVYPTFRVVPRIPRIP
jgi:hypothetical protein